MALISVIVPVYKVENYIERCLESIINQSFKDFEVILVDDGSPDRSGEICDSYALKDNRIHVIHKTNGGAADARNVALDWVFQNSQSEWIAFVDSDDWVHEKYLEVLYNAVKRTNYNISICDFKNTHGEEVYVNIEKVDVTICEAEDFFVDHHINSTVPWAKLYKKSCFENIRYPKVRICEDEFVTYKILFKEEKVTFVSQSLYYYFQNVEGVMHTAWSEERMLFFDALEEQFDYFLNNGYLAAAHLVARDYVWFIYTKMKKLKKDNLEDNKVLASYKERRKQYLRYLKVLDIQEPNDQWVLMKVKPIRTKLRIYVYAVLNKFSITKEKNNTTNGGS